MPDLKPPEVTLFHTDGCHLCEMAAQLLGDMKVTVLLQDICDDERLVERYGMRIPVLLSPSGDELNWPFDQVAVKQFLGV